MVSKRIIAISNSTVNSLQKNKSKQILADILCSSVVLLEISIKVKPFSSALCLKLQHMKRLGIFLPISKSISLILESSWIKTKTMPMSNSIQSSTKKQLLLVFLIKTCKSILKKFQFNIVIAVVKKIKNLLKQYFLNIFHIRLKKKIFKDFSRI